MRHSSRFKKIYKSNPFFLSAFLVITGAALYVFILSQQEVVHSSSQLIISTLPSEQPLVSQSVLDQTSKQFTSNNIALQKEASSLSNLQK